MENIGRYRITRELGRGAMGVVYHAIDPNIGRPVAIKTIRLRDVDNAEERAKLRERLFREARSAGILSHPNIVTIYDVEEEDGIAYIAMEFVDGPTLDRLLSTGEPMPQPRILSALRQAASALDYAHSKDIVHRDIKPGNIMLVEQTGMVKITDFGIAKITTGDQFTMTGNILGTPNYMSPEQVQGFSVDGRSDQFSLAVIAFEMLTGERPFAGEHLTTVVYRIVAEEPVMPQRLNPSLGGEIDAVLRRALSKKAETRFANCAEFIGSLETACAGTPGWQGLSRGAALDLPTVETPGVPVLPAPRPRRQEPRKRSLALPLILALLVAGGLIAMIALQMSGPSAAGSRQERRGAQDEPAGQTPAPEAAVKSSPAPPESEKPADAPKTEETDAAKPDQPLATPDEPDRSTKPSPLPRESRRAATPAPAVARPQQVAISTSPAGATAALDTGERCQTPCTMNAPPGRHSITFTLPGYHAEMRDVHVGEGTADVPLVTMRPQGGVLFVTSSPPGATISINGRRQSQSTPAQIPLPAGKYEITVERNGVQQTTPIEIRADTTRTMRVTFE